MAKLKLPSFSEGGLLQRTLLYVAAFVLGSVGFVTMASLAVVWVAKSVLPSHASPASPTSPASPGAVVAPEDDSDKPADIAAAPGKAGLGGRSSRPKRSKAPALAEDAPVEEAH